MKHTSPWIDKDKDTKQGKYPPLTTDIEVDVAIVGAGITGITSALHLIKADKKVAIVDALEIGGYTTSLSTGNLYIPVQPYYHTIAKKFNLEAARSVANARKKAIDFIEKQVKSLSIHCQFSRRPWYLYTNDKNKISLFEREVAILQKIGLKIKSIDSLPLGLKQKRAIVLEQQARLNPRKYVKGLATWLEKKGCLLYEKTPVIALHEYKKSIVLKTSSAKINAKQVILATHTPIGIHSVQTFTAPYRSYAVAVHLKNKTYPEGHFWDLSSPHHVLCTHAITKDHPELLVISGKHHKTGQAKNAQAHFNSLETFLNQHFEVDEVCYKWSAQHYHAADNLPYIGLASLFNKNIYMATGFFADGLLYGTLAGLVLADLIIHKKNAYQKLFDASRFKPFASASFLIKENTNVFLQYLQDLPFNASSPKDIRAGDGKIVEVNKQKWAVSRDQKNKLHIVSAVCTHMKCIVKWNNAEKTWDCPCHGSRFSMDGKVIEGPAQKNLAKNDFDI